MPKLGYREKCLAQKINACNVCGTDDSLIVHHLNGDQADDRLDNLMPVCRSCHTRIHQSRDPTGQVKQLQERLPDDAVRDHEPLAVKPTLSVPDSLLESVDGQRRGGQTRSEWVRRAFRTYIYAAQHADDFDGELPDQWVKHAIKEYLDQRRVEQHQEQEVLADG
jgi:hypothetical protein